MSISIHIGKPNFETGQYEVKVFHGQEWLGTLYMSHAQLKNFRKIFIPGMIVEEDI